MSYEVAIPCVLVKMFFGLKVTENSTQNSLGVLSFPSFCSDMLDTLSLRRAPSWSQDGCHHTSYHILCPTMGERLFLSLKMSLFKMKKNLSPFARSTCPFIYDSLSCLMPVPKPVTVQGDRTTGIHPWGCD